MGVPPLRLGADLTWYIGSSLAGWLYVVLVLVLGEGLSDPVRYFRELARTLRGLVARMESRRDLFTGEEARLPTDEEEAFLVTEDEPSRVLE